MWKERYSNVTDSARPARQHAGPDTYAGADANAGAAD